MGEYTASGLKMGTCEELMYLRASQRFGIRPAPGSVDPSSAAGERTSLFRFPWPDEDGTSVGAFDPPDRTLPVLGYAMPAEGIEHGHVTLNGKGLSLTMPCPLGGAGHAIVQGLSALRFRRTVGAEVELQYQRVMDGALWSVCQCIGCGRAFRLPPEEGEALAVAIRSHADVIPEDGEKVAWLHAVADRVLAGYSEAAA